MQILPVSNADIPDLISLILSFSNHMSRNIEPPNPESLQNVLFCDAPYAECFIGRKGREAVGFAFIEKTYSIFLSGQGLHIKDLFIKPDHRNKGYGIKFMAFIAKLVLDRDYKKLTWETRKGNHPAISLYKKLGLEGNDDGLEFSLNKDDMIRLARLC